MGDDDVNSPAPIQRTKTQEMQDGGGSLLQKFCCHEVVEKSACNSNPIESKKDAWALVEKMFACNFLVQDIEDDEYSFDDSKAFTLDDTINGSTFDTMSTGDFGRARRKSRKSR